MTFGVQNLFSLASRERFLTNIKKFRVPVVHQKNTASRDAAVLVPFCGVNNIPSLLYTLRSNNLKKYRGETSFPGGKTDNNETSIETALRETQEEIGLLAEKIDVWGCGPVFPSRDIKTKVTPVIGCIVDFQEADLCLNNDEVNKVFTVPLEELCDPKNQFHYRYSKDLIVPVFMVNGTKIFGITSYMTHMFLSCLLSKDVYKSDWMKKRIDIYEKYME